MSRVVEQFRILGVTVRQTRIDDGQSVVVDTKPVSVRWSGPENRYSFDHFFDSPPTFWRTTQHERRYQVESGEEAGTKKIFETDRTHEKFTCSGLVISEIAGYAGSIYHDHPIDATTFDTSTTHILNRDARNLPLSGNKVFGRRLRLKGI